MIFYTAEEYAEKDNVSVKTVYDRVKAEKLLEIPPLKQSKLIYEKDAIKEPIVIALSNLKGGCGKTTIAAHVAILLSKLNFRVLLIDTDHQNQCEMFFPEQSYNYTFKDLLSGSVNIKDCIYQTKTNDSFVDIIYSDYGLALFTRKFDEEEKLSKILDSVKKDYDFIIIDTAPDFDIININVIKASTHIIIPITPSPLHVKGMGHNFDALVKVAKISPDRIMGIVFSIVEEKAAQHKAYINMLTEQYEGLPFETVIPRDLYLPKVNDFNTNIFDYREKCKSSQALKKLTWEILRRL